MHPAGTVVRREVQEALVSDRRGGRGAAGCGGGGVCAYINHGHEGGGATSIDSRARLIEIEATQEILETDAIVCKKGAATRLECSVKLNLLMSETSN